MRLMNTGDRVLPEQIVQLPAHINEHTLDCRICSDEILNVQLEIPDAALATGAIVGTAEVLHDTLCCAESPHLRLTLGAEVPQAGR